MDQTPQKKFRRGQAALELIVFFGFMILVFTVFLILFLPRTAQDVKQQKWLLGIETARLFAGEINLAVAAGDGYARNFTFPTTIAESIPYAITIRSGFVELDMSTGSSEVFSYSAPTLTQNVTGLGAGGVNIVDVSQGFVFIRNIGGAVYLSQ